MKLETILNALERAIAKTSFPYEGSQNISRQLRQYNAFRARILRVDAEQRADILDLNVALDMVIADLEADEDEIAAQDARIAELENKLRELASIVNRHEKGRMITDKKLAWRIADRLLKELGPARPEPYTYTIRKY